MIFYAMLMCWLSPLAGTGQVNPADACRLDEGTIILTFDNRWNNEQKEQVISLFDVDSLLLEKAFENLPEVMVNGVTWKIRKIDANRVEVFKPSKSDSAKVIDLGDVMILDDDWIMTIKGEAERESVASGVNVLTRYDVFSYRNGVARFYLPGRLQAENVYISGTFNDWSTMKSPMQRTDSGWVFSLMLQPGKYLYKFIIDGRWSPDPYNRLKEDDLNGEYNSVIFCYNHRFFLRGFPDATRVFLAGSFNGWNGGQYRMQRVQGGWAIYLFLREGTHAYKYVVDGNWIIDPGNNIARPDGRGNMNSFLSIGDTLWFRLAGYERIRRVAVAGNFNAWNPGELFMSFTSAGWQLPYVLAPGNYEYKFITDGVWIPDPANPFTTGSGNYTNSFIPVNPNHMFTLNQYSDAKKVIVTGSFNGWSSENYRMVNKEGTWTFPIYLKPGKYTYKFIVDGKWILDPGNELWEENEYGTGNSVLWIEP
jgi:type 1 glutamine amidotransferase